MKNEVIRFFAVEHLIMMFVAIVLIHLGRAKSRKANQDSRKHRISAIYFTLALILILAGIPWDRAMF